MNCPKCYKNLVLENYEGISIERCVECQGVWLDKGEISTIIDKKEEVIPKEYTAEVLKKMYQGLKPAQLQAEKLDCPHCLSQLKPTNYDYKSGIIIDICPNGDGLWLDKGELEKIQAYREHWQNSGAEENDKWIQLAKMEVQRQNKLRDQNIFTKISQDEGLLKGFAKSAAFQLLKLFL